MANIIQKITLELSLIEARAIAFRLGSAADSCFPNRKMADASSRIYEVLLESGLDEE